MTKANKSYYDAVISYIKTVDPHNKDRVQVRYDTVGFTKTKQVRWLGNFSKWKIENHINRFNKHEFNLYTEAVGIDIKYFGNGIFKWYKGE